MNLKRMGLKFLVVLLAAALLAGCGSTATDIPTKAPTQVPQPTLNVQPTIFAVQTQAVQTFVANQTQNAPTATRVPPTNTPAPTTAPTFTATAQGTAVKPPATLTPKPAGPTITPTISCVVKSVYPNSTVTISPGTDFTARFVVLNTGGSTWTTAYTLTYISGARFGKQKGSSLPFSTGPNADITLTLDLTAPSNNGTYNATWAVLNGFQPVCLMGLTVIVK